MNPPHAACAPPADGSTRAHGAPADETGNVSIEWVAVAAVLIVILAAVAATATTVADRVAETVASLACHAAAIVTDADCASPGAVAGDEAPTLSCDLSAISEAYVGGVTAFSGVIEGEVGYEIAERGDDYKVTLTALGGLGGKLLKGGKLSFGEFGKAGAKGSVAITGQAETAPTFSFDSEDEAEAFVGEVRSVTTSLLADGIKDALAPGPPVDTLTNLWELGTFDPPEPDKVRYAGGVNVEATGEIGTGGGRVEGLAAAGGVLGVDVHVDGSRTVYVELDGEVAGELGVGLPGVPVEASAGGGGLPVGGHGPALRRRWAGLGAAARLDGHRRG